jgi:phage terminase large subunit-like protein
LANQLVKLVNSLSKDQVQSLYREYSRAKFLYFVKYCWQRSNEPFLTGLHTTTICNKLDKAIDNFRKGISTFLLIEVCFRHGKSELVSRYFPAQFLAQFPDCEVLLTSHSKSKANEFSRDTQGIIKSKSFSELYPDIKLQQGHSSVEVWGLEGRLGKSQYFGIQSGTAGAGGHLIIVDDYFGNREDAESLTIRTKVNEAFHNDIMSRRAPVSIVVVCVTPWHVEDIAGQIQRKIKVDPNFPAFEVIKFPAFSPQYPSGTLFPERFPLSWYTAQKAGLTNEQGEYGYLSLMQCEPISKAGNTIKVDKIIRLTKEEFTQEKSSMTCCRAWDLASTEKQTKKQDPDWTVGAKIWMKKVPSQIAGIAINKIYIEDIKRGRWEALKREQIIVSTALSDGKDCQVVIESYAGYKDQYTRVRSLLSGICQVIPYTKNEDKLIKASLLEIATEAGNVGILRDIQDFDVLIKEFSEFPSGNHDDIVDACAIGINWLNASSNLSIYTMAQVLEEIEANNCYFAECCKKLKSNARLSCKESFYPELRKYLTTLLENNDINIAKNAKNEISRLDKEFNHKEIYHEFLE